MNGKFWNLVIVVILVLIGAVPSNAMGISLPKGRIRVQDRDILDPIRAVDVNGEKQKSVQRSKSFDISPFPDDSSKSSYLKSSKLVRQAPRGPVKKSVAAASVTLLFAIMLWRSFVSFEEVYRLEASNLRLIALVPLSLLALANAFGLHRTMFRYPTEKSFLKKILIANLLREYLDVAVNALTWARSLSVSQSDEGGGRLFFNLLTIMQYQFFLRSRWVRESLQPAAE